MNFELIKEIEDILFGDPESLSTWETDFLESILEQLQEGRELSERQEDVLDRIYEKIGG